MTARVLLIVGTLLLFTAHDARAVTIDDVIALSKAGVADSVLVAVIDADQTVFNLTPQQIIDLKRAGVADSVVTRMVLTSRDFQGSRSGEEWPPVVVIGEKPQEPAPPPPPSFTVVTPIFVPVPVNRDHRHRPPDLGSGPHTEPPSLPQQPLLPDQRLGRGINDRRVDDAATHTAVCVRGGWVGWCSAR